MTDTIDTGVLCDDLDTRRLRPLGRSKRRSMSHHGEVIVSLVGSGLGWV